MADMFDLELHEDDRSGQDNACCESDDDIIEIDDVSGIFASRTLFSLNFWNLNRTGAQITLQIL